MRALNLVAVVVVGCGGKGDPGPAPGSAGGALSASAAGSARGGGSSGSTIVAGGSASTDPVPIAGSLRHAKGDEQELVVTFEGRVPVLPAISADGSELATFEIESQGMPPFPMPYAVHITRIDGKGAPERIVLIDDSMRPEEATTDDWKPPPAVVNKLRAAATAVEARLRAGGFVTLDHLEIERDSDAIKPFQLGPLVLTAAASADDSQLDVALSDAANKPVRRTTVKSYETKECPPSFAGGCCHYGPLFSEAYTDPAKRTLYVIVRFHFNEECTQPSPRIIRWPVEPATPSPDEAAIAKLVTGQLAATADREAFTTDAQLIAGVSIAGRDQPDRLPLLRTNAPGRAADLQIAVARDGKSGWASLTATPWRVSSVLARTTSGWRIAATTWTMAVTDAESERDAKAGKRAAGKFSGDGGDHGLREAFARLVATGVDGEAARRDDLVVIGTAPGERTVGGDQFAKVWGGAFKGKVTVVSVTAKLAPSGTTGWVAATLELPRAGYKLPFQAFCVFDKTPAGGWTLVHAHFSN